MFPCTTCAWRDFHVWGVPGLLCAAHVLPLCCVVLRSRLWVRQSAGRGSTGPPELGRRKCHVLRRKQQAPTAEPRRSGAAVKAQHVARPTPAAHTGHVTEQVRLLQHSVRPDKQPSRGLLCKEALLQSRAHPGSIRAHLQYAELALRRRTLLQGAHNVAPCN